MAHFGDGHDFYVVIDLKQLYNVVRMKHKLRKEIAEILGRGYWQWLRTRYIRNSRGGSTWPELEDSTIKRKERRQEQHGYSGDPYWKLSESGTLFHALHYRINIKGAEVGYWDHEAHPTNAENRGQISVTQLVTLHQFGTSKMPPRPIMELPSNQLMTRLKKAVRDQLGKSIKGYEK